MGKVFRGGITTEGKLFTPKIVVPPPKVDFISGGENAEVSYSMEGYESLVGIIDQLPEVAKDAAGYEMSRIASDIIEDARENYVPYEYGWLRDSAGFDDYVPSKGMDVADIGMWFGAPGGEITEVGGHSEGRLTHAELKAAGVTVRLPEKYAEIQHEDMSFVHPIVGPVSNPQHHYLSKPFDVMTPSVYPRIGAAIADAISTGNVSSQAEFAASSITESLPVLSYSE